MRLAHSPLSLASLDAVEWLRSLPDACADLIVTDPPYESLEKHRAVGTTTRLKHSKASSNDWFRVFPNSRFGDLFRELHRVLKRNRHCYVFSDQETMFAIKPIAEEVGFRFWKPIVWDKVTMGMGYHYRARYEFVLFFEKGKRRLNDLAISDVLSFKRVRNGYPAQKPLELMQTLILQSSESDELVLDPFFGSGTTFLASRRFGRSAWGTDIAPTAHRCAVDRLGSEGYWSDGPHSPVRISPVHSA